MTTAKGHCVKTVKKVERCLHCGYCPECGQSRQQYRPMWVAPQYLPYTLPLLTWPVSAGNSTTIINATGVAPVSSDRAPFGVFSVV